MSFILVNLWIDAPAILAWIEGLPLPSHAGGNHSLVGAMTIAAFIAMPGMRFKSWGYGAFLGALSHILLDGLVHPELTPFWPFAEGNPFYMGWMEPLSWGLMPLTGWLIVQYVSGSWAWLRKRRVIDALQSKSL